MSSGIRMIFLIGCLCIISISQVKAQSRISPDCSKCGITDSVSVRTIIIGGQAVRDLRNHPWQVTLMPFGIPKFCGGAIISRRYIITAAHCVRNKISLMFQPHQLQIGFLTPNHTITNGQPVERIIPHPRYNPMTFENDIALIKLKQNIQCGSYRNTVCLPSAGISFRPNTRMVITGWGRHISADNPSHPFELQETQVETVNPQMCDFLNGGRRLKQHICLKGINQSSACMGDSGGPLVRKQNGKFFTMGVTSHGSMDCNVNSAFVYTSVSEHMNWITEVSGVRPA